jgi:MFS transporter, DHA2 family, multidrug resistance protein
MSSMSPEATKATNREWIGLAVLALPCLLYSMDLTVLNLAVPKLSTALRPTGTELLWIVDIYGFILAGALIPMGVLGDRIGRRRLLLIGAAAFGCASVLAAFAPSVEALIWPRPRSPPQLCLCFVVCFLIRSNAHSQSGCGLPASRPEARSGH